MDLVGTLNTLKYLSQTVFHFYISNHKSVLAYVKKGRTEGPKCIRGRTSGL